VIGLLVLMLVLALPAMNFITGARSTESATNVIGAILGTARAQAIARQSNVGVIFFWDRTKEQTVAGLCTTAQPWDSTVSYVGYVPGTTGGDVVEYPAGSGIYYICISSVVGSPDPATNTVSWLRMAANPTNAGGYFPAMPVLLDGFELQTLPKGVGLQAVVIPNPTLDAALNSPTAIHQYDSYVSTACVMFDGEGRLTSQEYGIYAGERFDTPSPVYSRLGFLLQSKQNTAKATSPSDQGMMGETQIAIALYDRHAFHDAGFDENDYLAGDFTTLVPPVAPSRNQWATASGNEPQEEQWIDQNATFLLVNRYNGTLLKSE